MKGYISMISIIAAIVAVVGVSGCGSSGGGSAKATTLSGTAAGGAAIIGQACVKDSLNIEKCSLIDSLGGYSVDVGGMTAPFILRAKGQVGDTEVTYYSAATLVDIGNKVNITPFTDLIVSNLAGQIAKNYYDSNSSLSVITDKALLTKTTALQRKLAPALSQLGLDSSIDLLRASFNADHTGMDILIDLIKVDVDTTTGIATLKNAINQVVISTDNFALSTDDNASVDVKGIANLSTGMDDITAIKTKMNVFAQLFSTTTPSIATIQNCGLFDTTESFINDGQNFEQFATMLSTTQDIIGITFANITITFNSPAEGHVLADILDKTGHFFDKIDLILKKAGNTWLVEGNGRIVGMSVYAEAQYYVSKNINQGVEQNGSGMNSALNIWIDPSQSSYEPQVASAHIDGPGLGNGVDFTTKNSDGSLGFVDNNYTTNWISQCSTIHTTNCFNYSQTADNDEYTIILKNTNGTNLNGVGNKFRVPTRPINVNSLTISMFPSITSAKINGVNVTTLNQLMARNATMAVEWTLPVSTNFKSFIAWAYANGYEEYFKIVKDNLGINALGTSFIINSTSTSTPNSAGMEVRVIDPATSQRYSFSQSISNF